MHLSSMDISFWRHKSKQVGKAKLYCRITVDGVQKDIGSTGLTIWADHWDGEHISHQDPEAMFKNEQLDSLRLELRATWAELFRKKESITADKIKRAFLNKTGTGSVSLLTAFQLYLDDSRLDRERNLRKSSLTVYENVRKKLTDFLISESATELLIEDFDLIWVKRYRNWMKRLPLGEDQVGHADSYVAKQTQTIKNVLTWAKLNKLADSNPLDGFRVKGATYGDPVYLSNDEFERLQVHRFKRKIMQETADVFVILCRSGFHYGDLLDFVKKHKTALRQGIDNKPWLIKQRIKTEATARVPLFEEVADIVTKYGGWEKLPLRPLAKFNFHLKIVADELKLPEDLSSKAGRKTFTDWCFNTLLLSTDSVKVLLGRKSDKGLEVYGRPDERRVIAELKKASSEGRQAL